MHPEIVQDHPGACPKCGMMLEPMIPSVEDGPSAEEVDLKRRFWVGVVLTVPVFVVSMGGMFLAGGHDPKWMRLINVGQLILSTPVVLWCGWPFFERAWNSLLQRSPNMFTLIGLGVGAAYGYSVFATLLPEFFPEGFRTAGHAVEPYFESAAVIIVLVLLGQILEMKARGHASSALRRLVGLAQPRRLVSDDGPNRTCHSNWCNQAIVCAFARESVCRWMGLSSPGRARSMNRSLRVSRSRLRRGPTQKCSQAR